MTTAMLPLSVHVLLSSLTMIDWKSFFPQDVLTETEGYKVTRLRKLADNEYAGDVRSDRVYQVTVSVSEDGMDGDCRCEVSRRGYFCGHMGALCRAIEKKEPGFFGTVHTRTWTEEELSSPTSDPFSSKEGSGCFFDTKKIFSKSLKVTEAMVKAARELIDSGAVRDFSFIYDAAGTLRNEFTGSCIVRDGDEDIQVRVKVSDDCINYIRCLDSNDSKVCVSSNFEQEKIFGWVYFGVSKYSGTPCIHKLVLCLLVSQYIWENDPGDATDDNASRLMAHVAGTRKIFRPDFSGEREIHKDGQVVDIIPAYNSNDRILSFTIGVSKQYVVSDIPGLAYKYSNKTTMKLGRNTLLDFSVDTLTERGKAVMSFMSSLRYPIKKTVNIDNGYLDSMYLLCDMTEVLNEKGEVMEATTAPARLVYDIKVSRHRGSENRITVKITFPERGSDKDYGYLFMGNTIVRMNMKELGSLYDICPGRAPYTKTYTFGKERLAEFYNSVLPLLEQYGDVRRSIFTDSRKWAALVPSFAFFLDLEDDVITCEAHMVLDGKDTCMKYDGSIHDDEHTDAKWIRSQLNALFPAVSDGLWKTQRGNPDQIYTIIRDGIPVLAGLGEVNVSDALKNINVRKPSVINANVSFENDLLELDIETKDMSGQELLELLGSYRLKKRYHRLKDGSFIDLSDNAFDEFAEVADSLSLTDDQIISGHAEFGGYRALFLDQLLDGRKDIVTDRDSTFRKMVRDFTGFRESEMEVPSSLSSTMRPYQKDGFRWLRTLYDYRFGGILADEMGLGKTLQVISLMLSLKQSGEEGTNLVVCPASLVYNWEAEVGKFAPELSCCVIAGTPDERKSLIASVSKHDVAITSYDLLKRDVSSYKDKNFHILIIDEAQYVKNQGTGASKTVRILNAKVRFALTGTPIENRLSELWSIFDFLMPGFLYNYERFRREIENPVMKKSDPKASGKLKGMVSPFILRRLKTDVLRDLPEKLEEVSFSEMTDGQRKLYDAKVLLVRKEVEATDEQSFKTNKLQILSELTRLRQLCCDPSLVFADYKEGSGKLDSTMDLVERAIDEGHRMLLFSQFTTMLSTIAAQLDKKNIRYYVITGETPKSERLRLVENFNNGSIPVFLISLRAGGTGLNLTGADVVIHYDPWWNAAVQDQATDRAHRIGQTKVVTVYSMIAKNTIEEKIMKMQERKKDLADEVLSGETTGLSSLTREDLLEMLS